MNTFSNFNTETNQSETAALLTTPGAATIKAFSIVINSLLQPQLLVDEVKSEKRLSGALVNENIPPSVDAVQTETSLITKAQGMVHHLKHTHGGGLG